LLRAILFDFDGVVADTEPIHFRGFQKILQEEGHTLTKQDYYSRYLGYDDWVCFKQIYKDHKIALSRTQLEQLVSLKTRYVKSLLRSQNVLLPGVGRAIKLLARRFPIVIVSGALRQEVILVLKKAGLQSYFAFVLGAEDVRSGKPHPEGYLKALKLLNENIFSSDWPLAANECLIIEDSHWGIEAAMKAKMPCVAVTSSYTKKELRAADMVIGGLNDIRVSMIPALERLTN
jgi:HAD superfamily hydrolase (TIGR01509 family)